MNIATRIQKKGIGIKRAAELSRRVGKVRYRVSSAEVAEYRDENAARLFDWVVTFKDGSQLAFDFDACAFDDFTKWSELDAACLGGW